MKIEIESSVPQQRSFSELRQELTVIGKKFDAATLKLVPYAQLPLCCIGNAGDAACLPNLVQQEKRNRRERFLNMEPEELKQAEAYLKIERMYDDVVYALAIRTAPKWEGLSTCQKLWAKLTCLYNHVDNLSDRMAEVTDLFAKCAADRESGLPADVCTVYASKLRGMASVHPGRMSDEAFRTKLGEIAETLLEFMTPEERQMLEKEQIQDFSCTSDCFRIA